MQMCASIFFIVFSFNLSEFWENIQKREAHILGHVAFYILFKRIVNLLYLVSNKTILLTVVFELSII